MSLRKLLLLCVSLCLPLSANAADDMGPTLKRISESGRINLGYRDPESIDPQEYADREDEGVLLVPKAGEQLFRLAD